MNLTQIRDIAMIVAILFIVIIIGYYWVGSIIESLQKKLRIKENKELPVEKQLQFTHYNPHPHSMDVDDDSIRAISAMFGLSWDEAFKLQVEYAIQCKAPTSSKNTMYSLLGAKGFERLSLSQGSHQRIELINLSEEALLEGPDNWAYTDGTRYYDSKKDHGLYEFYWIKKVVAKVPCDPEVPAEPEPILPPNLRPAVEQDPYAPR